MAAPLQLSFVNFAENSYIIVEGKRNADKFFIIRTGKVRLSKEVQIVAEEQGDTLGPGDFFGVVSTMSGNSHIETARALTDVTLISVQKEQFSQLIQNNAPVALKIILQFSKRMRYLDEALTRLTLKNNAAEDASHIFEVAEYYAKQNQFDQAFYAYQKFVKCCPKDENTQTAIERLKKIAPYVKNVQKSFPPGENNRTYTKGQIVFCEGEPGDELFVIQKGSVKIIKVTENNEILLAVLKTGDIFGEMALLESKPRAAGAVAYEDCQLMAVNKENFQKMISTQPQLISRLTTLLSERIWLIYRQIINTQISEPLGRMYDMLQIQLDKKKVDIMSSTNYSFDFGLKELINMVGLSQGDASIYGKKLMENHAFQIMNEKLFIKDVKEIPKQIAYYRKMQHLEKVRLENKPIA
ncbi:MAG: cyclic nucleotide-binding domain-containing protein [Treponema sp.]|nr:cyclic nucleotide-binding domain-containing protein [Treponema sp.]MCL2236654.1 cyclic nucleotide-binding domain-containing protein [Treponema sp.]